MVNDDRFATATNENCAPGDGYVVGKVRNAEQCYSPTVRANAYVPPDSKTISTPGTKTTMARLLFAAVVVAYLRCSCLASSSKGIVSLDTLTFDKVTSRAQGRRFARARFTRLTAACFLFVRSLPSSKCP